MSTATKIFIVLHVIFSITFVAWSVQFAATVNNYKDNAEKYQQLASEAQTSQRHTVAVSATKLATLNQKIEEDAKTINDLQLQLEKSQTEHNATKAELAQGNRKNESLGADIAKLGASLELLEKGWGQARDQRTDIEKQLIDLQTRNQDLSLRNDELIAQNLVLGEQVRQLKQQNYTLRDQVAKGGSIGEAMAVGPGLDGITEATPASTTPIRGSILEFKGGVASIDLGAADGVAEGMNFIIHRAGGSYLGELVVSDVEPNQAAGRVTLQQGIVLRTGDLVTDEGGLGK